jgi:hypothetical protein
MRTQDLELAPREGSRSNVLENGGLTEVRGSGENEYKARNSTSICFGDYTSELWSITLPI